MKPEQRIVIAEACGWIKMIVPMEDDLGPIDGRTVVKWKRPCNPHGYVDPAAGIPDYPNDLNAMHEAEKVLSDTQLIEYCNRLSAPVSAIGIPHKSKAICATAAQRAEAFLRTIGKWVDQ